MMHLIVITLALCRVAAMFRPGEVMSDNAMISVYPVGDAFYAFTESPVMTRVDPVTLHTLERVRMPRAP